MRKILVVDDEANLVEAVKENLEAAGSLEVFGCSESNKVLLEAKKCRPDLIFLDVLMPGFSGPEVAEKLRRDPETREIPVVFLTAIVSEEDTQQNQNLIGGERFLAKPVKTDELLRMIDSVLSSHGRGQAA